MFSEEEIEKLRRAGWIAKTVLESAGRIVKPGLKIVDLVNYIESKIEELSGEPAFPVNVGINDVAAHYTPLYDDEESIPDNAVVKIDVGVHVDGYIADAALTLSLSSAHEGLVEAPRRALERALEIVRPGIRVSLIGKVIEETIRKMGYRVVKNLSGHGMDRYVIHCCGSIPNYYEPLNRQTVTSGVYAIEPFATNGVGLVRSGDLITIYSLKDGAKRGLGSSEGKLVDVVWSSRRTLPFCERWYVKLFSSIDELRGAIGRLISRNVVRSYPILVEDGGGVVSQFEHTVVVCGKDVIVTTM